MGYLVGYFMNNFNVSLLANISTQRGTNCNVMADIFKFMLVKEGSYLDELISVSFVPIHGVSLVNQPCYRKGEYLYSLIVTGTASSFTALKLGKILVKVLDDFTEKYGTCYFLYSMFVERKDKKDLCVQSSQERVFYDKH